jgi:hypothetical protein
MFGIYEVMGACIYALGRRSGFEIGYSVMLTWWPVIPVCRNPLGNMLYDTLCVSNQRATHNGKYRHEV